MKTQWNLVKKVGILTLILLFVYVGQTFAATPAPVEGARRLAQDVLRWILILVPVTAACMLGYHAWMKSIADGDQGVIAQRNQAMKRVLIFSIFAMCAAAITQSILSYF